MSVHILSRTHTVTHPSTNQTQCCLPSSIRLELAEIQIFKHVLKCIVFISTLSLVGDISPPAYRVETRIFNAESVYVRAHYVTLKEGF